MNKILVVGYKGKMGGVVYKKLVEKGYKIYGKDVLDDINKQEKFDVVIDFSVPDYTLDLAEWCLKNKVPLIIGTTGHSENQLEILKNYALGIPILKAGNFSIGVLALKKSLEKIMAYNPKDIVIYEKHHNQKKDIPSGTALELKNMIENCFEKELVILSERGGKEVGEHTINFYFDNEVISITHKAYSRECFADGVAKAVEFMVDNKKNAFYKFSDIF